MGDSKEGAVLDRVDISGIPTPSEQIEFLQKIERLLSEGQFVASYKFALLRALADLSVELGDDSGHALPIPITAIAEEFVELYWRQVRPIYEQGQILRQNTGQQAKIVQIVSRCISRYCGNLSQFQKNYEDWNRTILEVAQVIRLMPLWRLQVVGRRSDEFLYQHSESNESIILKGGVAFCFRRFYSMIRNMVEGSWINFIRSLNLYKLGESLDLPEFLFGSVRAPLSALQPGLLEIQNGLCFYCSHPIRQDSAIDHFIPWSSYPSDLGHNLVLADARCNSKKGNLLPAEAHLEKWLIRTHSFQGNLEDLFLEVNFPFEYPLSVAITRWAYAQTDETNGVTWNLEDERELLTGQWRSLLGPEVTKNTTNQ
ncbi:MAG: HNH endonuclease [Coprothermobacterota bacterium]|nr:HNH endonuclease [Coprothermobacterota bacterium]